MTTMRFLCTDCGYTMTYQWDLKGESIKGECPRCHKSNVVNGIGAKRMPFPYHKQERVKTTDEAEV